MEIVHSLEDVDHAGVKGVVGGVGIEGGCVVGEKGDGVDAQNVEVEGAVRIEL